jgi:HSP20 family protein
MSEEKDSIRRIWVPGCMDCSSCSDEDVDNVTMTFDIPGVNKEDIDLRVIPDGMRLKAKRDPTTEYVSEYEFICPADVSQVKANYNEGVLEVSVPLTCKDPFSDIPKVDLS